METGFLNPIHDEEHFSSTLYTQNNGLEDSDHMLFGEMIVPEVIDHYDHLWHSVDDIGEPSQSNKDDFKKMVFEWQHQLTCMQEPEVIKQIVPVAEKTTKEISDMFKDKTSNHTDPCIDELFPLECNKETIDETKYGVSLTKLKTASAPILSQTIKKEKLNIQLIKIEALTELALPGPNVDEGLVPTLIPKTENQNIKATEPLVCETVGAPEPLVCTDGGDPELVVYATLDNAEHLVNATVRETKPLVSESVDKPEELVSANVEKLEPLVDVETVEEGSQPLLLAGDLTSLLEQFEATEKVNAGQPAPVSPPAALPSNQTIRDALPEEVIKRIKASRESHKKIIPVIPAMPTKKQGRGTRMQDAGVTLCRNKLLKLVTGGSSGESVQLDHDYCNSNGDTSSSSSRSQCVSDACEYPSQSSTPGTVSPHHSAVKPTDSGSRKDSGLESAENSEDEFHPVGKTNKIIVQGASGLKTVNVVTENGFVIGSAPVMPQMVSLLKKKNTKAVKVNTSENNDAIPNECHSPAVSDDTDGKDSTRKKKKLNLEEYRVRREERDKIRSQESSRANSPIPCSTPPIQPDSTTSTMATEGVAIAKDKPIMLSVEVQTQTCDFVDLTSSKSSKDRSERSRAGRSIKRNDFNQRSYRSRHSSSSSSSSSSDDSDRRHSHRRKKNSKRRNKHRKSSASRMWSVSPSRSRSRSHSLGSSRSKSRSRSRDRRQKWRSRSPRRYNSHRYNNPRDSRGYRRGSRDRDVGWSRSRSPMMVRDRPQQVEKGRQIEERRVIYVGRIQEGTAKADLRSRFQQFGPIVDISVHFRERGDNYGFVTFAYKGDAYKAVEHGNDDPNQPRYDLCFGGRRAFCKQRYADLDGMASNNNYNMCYGPPVNTSAPGANDSFDLLLHEMKNQLCKRSSV